MAKINILPAKVYNRIAAGEVVDRPYSVVKELVENAIDAGATEIEISIEKGGKQLIRVTDNGSGIERDDLQSAFLPHATSKIAKAEDLESILTLGFRGEAVASIASVSKMTITSKTKDGKCYSLSSNGGELGEILEAAGADGTDVKVEMLFFNTPVRLGFLKSEKAEETDITNVVSRFILSRPNIAFTYYANGKKVLQSFGGGDEEALVGVYGSQILSNTYKIDAEKHGIRIRGYIGNQNYSKPNKTYQSVFLNGRYILNTTISAAIGNAYSGYLMKRQYPFYVLHIDVPTEIVDVNVHPNKADVRFADNQIIYGCIYTVIAAVLDGNSKALEYIVDNGRIGKKEPFSPVVPTVAPQSKKDEPKVEPIEEKTKPIDDIPKFSYRDALKEMEKSSPAFTAKKFGLPPEKLPFDVSDGEEKDVKEPKKAENGDNLDELDPAKRSMKTLGYIPNEAIPDYVPLPDEPKKKGESKTEGKSKLQEEFPGLFFEKNYLEVNDSSLDARANEGAGVDVFAENKKYLSDLDEKAKQNKIDVSTCVYVGKLFNTYLLYERDFEVYIIDQHAAHERLIFNRLKERMQNRSVDQQPMLLPYVLELNAFEGEFIRENIEHIRAMGFDIEEFGANTFKISAVPVDLRDIDVGVFFNDILGDISGFRSIKLADILKDKLATAACKAAVKGGMDLTRTEIDSLFAMMDGDMGLKCPHGRPVVVKMTKTEIEKMFKRIV